MARHTLPHLSEVMIHEVAGMRPAGFGLLAAGWLLVLAALALLGAGAGRIAFVCAGLGVETLGLVFVFRSHLIPAEDKR